MDERRMKKWLSVIAVLILTILSEHGFSIENPSVRSPVVSGTVPPSSIASGLIPTPNPIDDSGNLVITGNVTAGKHFRGHVPYGSTTNFRASLGSSSLDSFLRYSADSADFDRYSRKGSGTFYSSIGPYRPFFSPSATVATLSIGQPNVSTSATRGFERPGSSFRSIPADGGLARPSWSRTPQELEKLISAELGTELYQPANLRHLRSETATAEQNQPATSAFGGADMPLVDLATPLPLQPGYVGRVRQGFTDLPQTVPSGYSQLPEVFPSNAAELDRLISEVETKVKAKPRTSASSVELQTNQQPNVYKQVQQRLDELVRPKTQDARHKTQDLMETPETMWDKSISGRKSLASFTTDKFNWYMQAAKLYLKQGRFYRAADSYTMASIYKPGEPSAYIGKSHALFAAGEYMTSALFLSRAIEVTPEYARLKVDLVDILGDQDKFARRVADVEQRLEVSGAAELQFLLGYIYYQSFLSNGTVEDELDRLDAAKRLIDAAYQNLPNSGAVGALRKAVDDAINR